MRAVIGVLLNLTHDNGETQIDKFLNIIFPITNYILNIISLKRHFSFVYGFLEWGSTKTGEQDGLILTALDSVLKVPRYLPQEQRFDIRVLVRAHENNHQDV